MAFWSKKPMEKEKIEQIEPPIELPTDKILSMRQQRISNNQIIQELQRQGYSSSQIFDAMNQADLSQQSQFPETPYPQEQMESSYQEESKEKIEELAEVIIDEKWNILVKDINKIVEWKDNVEKKIEELDKRINDIYTDVDSLKKNILSKLNQYDRGISGVGTSIKAMETAFSKILPTFTENVNELSRITKKIKG